MSDCTVILLICMKTGKVMEATWAENRKSLKKTLLKLERSVSKKGRELAAGRDMGTSMGRKKDTKNHLPRLMNTRVYL